MQSRCEHDRGNDGVGGRQNVIGCDDSGSTPPSPRPPHLSQVSSNYIDARLPTVITAGSRVSWLVLFGDSPTTRSLR